MLRPNPPLASLVAEATTGLSKHFGAEARHVAAAPGRVNLIGEHIDYCDGFVLPFAIDRNVVIAGSPNGASSARIRSGSTVTPVDIPLSSPLEPDAPSWSNYIRGVIRGFQDLGHDIPGFDAHIVSSVPGGAGLSSSAALECATATFLESLLGVSLDKRAKALLCQKAEHDFPGVPCGIMDQFASVFGEKDKLVLIDCRSAETTLIPFLDPGVTILIANTNVHHELTDGGYATRRKQTEDALALLGKSSWRDVAEPDVLNAREKLGDLLFRRARHVVTEISRTSATATALSGGDIGTLGELMAASHDSLRDDFEVSCRELDLMVEIARGIGREGGVIGARMTGGGFGGSTVTLCDSSHAAAIAARLTAAYQSATGITPDIFASRPAAGAHRII